MEKWTREAEKNPFQAARELSQNSCLDLGEALSHELKRQGYKPAERTRLLLALENPEDVEHQGTKFSWVLANRLSSTKPSPKQGHGWMGAQAKLLEECAKSTVVNWETKLQGLASWYGSNVVRTMSRKDANAYKLHLVEKGLS